MSTRDTSGRGDVPLGRLAGIVGASVVVKLVYAAIVARAAPGGLTWFQTTYDAPAYLSIARSFPMFQSTPDLVATARWYPFSPFVMWCVAQVSTFDVAALIVPVAASSAAVGLVYAIACRCRVTYPGLVAAWFLLLPPKWFLLGVFPMSEAVYVALAVAAALCAVEGRFKTFLVLLTLVTLTKATAVLFVAVFALWFGLRHLKRTAATLAVLAAPLALQLYLAAFHGFDRFPLLLHAQSGYQDVEYSSPTGVAFSWPLRAIVEGATDSSIPVSYRIYVLAEFGAYLFGTVLAWRNRRTSDLARLTFLWLAVFFVFHLFVYGSIHLAGFRGYTRLMIPAAPALLLAYAAALAPWLESRAVRVVTVAAAAAVSLFVVVSTLAPILPAK